MLDNTLSKKFISIRINYSDYKANKQQINKLINDGYMFGIIIDDTFDGNINELVLFSCIYVDGESEISSFLDKKKQVMPKMIKL